MDDQKEIDNTFEKNKKDYLKSIKTRVKMFFMWQINQIWNKNWIKSGKKCFLFDLCFFSKRKVESLAAIICAFIG